MVAGVLAAFGFAGGVLIDKFELSKRHLPLGTYLTLLFLLLAFLSGVFLVIVPGQMVIPTHGYSVSMIGAFVTMIALAIGWNIFYYRGLKKEKVQEFDLILMTEPLVTIMLASAFFPAERKVTILMAALLAALALMFAHMHHRRLTIDTYARGLLIAVLLMSLEVLVIRTLLRSFTPGMLYFLRTTLLFVTFYFLYKPRFRSIKLADFGIVFVTALFGVLQMLARFFGYSTGGVVVTTLFLLLGPVLVEAASLAVLHESLKPKTGFAFAVIFACVAYVSTLGIL